MAARFVRLAEKSRSPIALEIDGEPVQALQGDTLLVAILCKRERVRVSEFGDGSRAGFCLMGACQDCWVWTAQGARVRACSTLATHGMKILTSEPQSPWSHA
jgi:D-hydroxyproline dehydrogenase subunit gamma